MLLEIQYHPTQVRRLLLLGIIFTVIGCLFAYFSDEPFRFALLPLGVAYIAIALIQKSCPMVTLADNHIAIGIFKRRIKVEEIESIKYFAGDFIIKSAGKETRIDTNLVNPSQLAELQQYFKPFLIKASANT